jgi:hypothetical protein
LDSCFFDGKEIPNKQARFFFTLNSVIIKENKKSEPMAGFHKKSGGDCAWKRKES